MAATPVCRRGGSARGFTLAESLVASVVLALAVVGVSGAIISSQKQTIYQEEDAAAVMLARGLMEEVASTPLTLSGGGTGAAGWPTITNRGQYDTVGDFNGYTDVVNSSLLRGSAVGSASLSASPTPSVTVIVPPSSTPTLTSQQYLRTVQVTYPTSAFGTTVNPGDIVVVTVSVRGGGTGGPSVQLSRVLTKTSFTR